jgi:hypothetical protein
MLDPLIHDPERLRVVTLAALPDGDALSASRLQDLIKLPRGRLITRLDELGRAGTTYGELSRAARDLPAPTGRPARPRRKPRWP